MLYGNANIAIYFKKDSIMTKEEFLNLDYGMVVKRNQHPELYEIDETDVFGAERDGTGRQCATDRLRIGHCACILFHNLSESEITVSGMADLRSGRSFVLKLGNYSDRP